MIEKYVNVNYNNWNNGKMIKKIQILIRTQKISRILVVKINIIVVIKKLIKIKIT